MSSKKQKQTTKVIAENFDWDSFLDTRGNELPCGEKRFRLHDDRTYTRRRITALAESITANGLFAPIVAWIDPHDPKLYHVVDGCKRILAMVAAGMEMPDNGVRVISEPDSAEESCLRLMLQGSSRSMSISEKTSLLAKIRESTDWTFQEMGQHTGLASSTIARLLQRNQTSESPSGVRR